MLLATAPLVLGETTAYRAPGKSLLAGVEFAVGE